MARMKIYKFGNAPEASRAMMETINSGIGGVPSLIGVVAASPLTFELMLSWFRGFLASSLHPDQCQLVLLCACREYGNEYCLEMQSYLADDESGSTLPEHVIRAVREGSPEDQPWEDKTYNVLWLFVASVVRSNGRIPDDDLAAIRDAGFSDVQILDILTGINLASYWTHIAGVADLKPDRKLRWSGARGSWGGSLFGKR